MSANQVFFCSFFFIQSNMQAFFQQRLLLFVNTIQWGTLSRSNSLPRLWIRTLPIHLFLNWFCSDLCHVFESIAQTFGPKIFVLDGYLFWTVIMPAQYPVEICKPLFLFFLYLTVIWLDILYRVSGYCCRENSKLAQIYYISIPFKVCSKETSPKHCLYMLAIFSVKSIYVNAKSCLLYTRFLEIVSRWWVM